MKKLITIMSLAIVGFTFGQEDEPKFNVSGSVDAYWRANLSAPNDEANTGALPYAAPSVFANQSGFSVGMANVTFSYEGDDVGFVADFAYGPRANAGVDLNSPDAGGVINEAYMYWNASENMTLYMGRFNNWMGYERLSPVDNFNYSMSHAFSFGVRNVNGLAANFDLGNDFKLGVGVMNPVDITYNNNTGDYSVAFGLSKGDTGASVISSQDATFIDFKHMFNINDNFSMGLNVQKADYEDSDSANGRPGDGFTSVSLYPQIQSSDEWSYGLRLEYIAFDDFVTDNVITPTFTVNYQVGDLTIKPELRLDMSEADIFMNNDGDSTANLSSFVLGAVYSF